MVQRGGGRVVIDSVSNGGLVVFDGMPVKGDDVSGLHMESHDLACA